MEDGIGPAAAKTVRARIINEARMAWFQGVRTENLTQRAKNERMKERQRSQCKTAMQAKERLQ